ncbi:MAG: heavy metal-binding domain-containing protein [Saprospiraceae bacterium]
MKNLKLVLPLFLFALATLVFACGDGASKGDADKTEQGKEYTSAYICPMHCEGSGSDAAGTCPVCKMDYVANEKATKTDSHEGHDHDSHEGHSH